MSGTPFAGTGAHSEAVWFGGEEATLNVCVVQVFSGPAALDRLAAAVLAEFHDAWQVFDRHCLPDGFLAEICTARPTEDNRRLSPPVPNQPSK